MDKEMQLKKNKMMATVLTAKERFEIDVDDMPSLTDFEEFSVEDLLKYGEGLTESLLNMLNQPNPPPKKLIEIKSKEIAAIMKLIMEKNNEKSKTRAEIAADKEH